MGKFSHQIVGHQLNLIHKLHKNTNMTSYVTKCMQEKSQMKSQNHWSEGQKLLRCCFFLHFPLAVSLKCSSLFSLPFAADDEHCAWPRLEHNWLHLPPLFSWQTKGTRCCNAPAILFLDEVPESETIWRIVNTVSAHQRILFYFWQFSCIVKYYFSGDRKVNCLSCYQIQITSLSKDLKTKV